MSSITNGNGEEVCGRIGVMPGKTYVEKGAAKMLEESILLGAAK